MLGFEDQAQRGSDKPLVPCRVGLHPRSPDRALPFALNLSKGRVGVLPSFDSLVDSAPEVQQQVVRLQALRDQLGKLEGSLNSAESGDYVVGPAKSISRNAERTGPRQASSY